MNFLARRKEKKSLASFVEQPGELLLEKKHERVKLPIGNPDWPIYGAGNGYLSVNGTDCAAPEEVIKRYFGVRRMIFCIVVLFLPFLFLAVGFDRRPYHDEITGWGIVIAGFWVFFLPKFWRVYWGDKYLPWIQTRVGRRIVVGLRPEKITFYNCRDDTDIMRRPNARLVAGMQPLDQATTERDKMQLARDVKKLKKAIFRTEIYRRSAQVYVVYGDYEVRVLCEMYDTEKAARLVNAINGAEEIFLTCLARLERQAGRVRRR